MAKEAARAVVLMVAVVMVAAMVVRRVGFVAVKLAVVAVPANYMDFQAARLLSSPRTSWKWSMRRLEACQCDNDTASIRSNVQKIRCLE